MRLDLIAARVQARRPPSTRWLSSSEYKRRRGSCWDCPAKAPPDARRCSTCAAKHREKWRAAYVPHDTRYKPQPGEPRSTVGRRLLAGVCRGCGKVPPVAGRQSCEPCAQVQRKRTHASKAKRHALAQGTR